MLNQMIYTRCYPHRDPKNNGQVIREDGMGYFSMSEQLFSEVSGRDMERLCRAIAVLNGSNQDSETVPTPPPGLLNSYEYQKISPDAFLFSYEAARPFCRTPRKNHIGHRTGTHVKHCLVGEISGYPCEWFGSEVWNAHKKTELEYYLDEVPGAAPDFLPQISGNNTGGYVNPSAVKRFVEDGRTEAVKAGIWFLLKEFEKPENERKVLLIMDVPENVEFWIAAMEYGFSEAMAREITFTTNRSKLVNEEERALFYYTDENGRFCLERDRRIRQLRHPYCMIAGYHPEDKLSAPLRQMPASNFVILDGVGKTFGFQPDDTIRKPYFSAVVKYDTAIRKFCNTLPAELSLSGISGKLPDLFDAYQYLLAPGHKTEQWSYEDILSKLLVLKQSRMLEKYALNEGLWKECRDEYPRFWGADERRGWKLLQILLDMFFDKKALEPYEMQGISEKEEDFFQMTDRILLKDTAGEVLSHSYKKMKDWGRSLGMVSGSAALFEFKSFFLEAQTAERALELARSFSDMNFTIEEDFLKGKYFTELCHKAAGFQDAGIHREMLGLYDIRDKCMMRRYAEMYISNVIGSTKNRCLVPELLSLCEAVMYPYERAGLQEILFRDMQELLQTVFAGQLVKCFRKGLPGRVKKNRTWSPEIKEKLVSMLLEAEEKTEPVGKAGFFRRLLKKHQRK